MKFIDQPWIDPTPPFCWKSLSLRCDSFGFCVKVVGQWWKMKVLINVFVFKKNFWLLMLCLPFYFLLSDSSALDTQVFTHYYQQPCAFVILLHVHVLVHICLVFGHVRLRGVFHTSELNLKTTPIQVPVFLNRSPLRRCEGSMCLTAILLSLCDACPFITILFQRMICVSNWVFWLARRECYTIDKSGLKHQERQNSPFWAHKLHWCGIISYFAWGAPLFLLSYHLSYPKLTSECVGLKELLV